MPINVADMSQVVLLAQSFDLNTTEKLITTGILVVVGLVSYGFVRRIGRGIVNRLSVKEPEQAERYVTLWTVLRKVASLVIGVLVVLFGFTVWGVSITPFLALGTVFAAALGFGAQDLVKDFLSGFFILAEDQFHLGDTVTIAGATGTVEDIQLRVTVLRDMEGNVHYVPNGQIDVASNFTSKYSQPVIDVGIAYESDVDHAIEVLTDELGALAADAEFGQWITEEPEVLGVNKLEDSAVVLRARLTTTAEQRWLVRREALRRIKIRFDAEGISIPYPQITLSRKS